MQPSDIIGTPDGSQGPPEVRYRAHVAMSTAYEILQHLEQVHDRRKAFIYVSEGYDFDPFARSRAKASAGRTSPGDPGQAADVNPFSKSGNEFAAADLVAELGELTREANRANTTIFTIDPRGLAAGAPLDQTTLDSTDWQDHVRETQSSLRMIAEAHGRRPGDQLERLRARAEADRQPDQRLLPGRLLLGQSRPGEKAPRDRNSREAGGGPPPRSVPAVLQDVLHAQAGQVGPGRRNPGCMRRIRGRVTQR